jgi:hypothetical protein
MSTGIINRDDIRHPAHPKYAGIKKEVPEVKPEPEPVKEPEKIKQPERKN